MDWRLDHDMAGVAMVGDQPIGVAVSMRAPYASLDELLAAARKEPGTIAFGTSGLGTSQHIVGEWLTHLAGVQMIHVPCKGGGQAVTDLVSGTTPAAVLGFAPCWKARSGGIRIVAVTTAERNPPCRRVPTLTELGYPQITRSQWVGVVAPRDTPPAIVKRLSDAMAAIGAQPAIQDKAARDRPDAQVDGCRAVRRLHPTRTWPTVAAWSRN